MSQYLCIYGKLKDSDKKISLYYCSRNSDVFQEIYESEVIHIKWNQGKEEDYTEIDVNTLLPVVQDLKDRIDKEEQEYSDLFKLSEKNKDYYDCLLMKKEYLQELRGTLQELERLQWLIQGCLSDAFDKLYMIYE